LMIRIAAEFAASSFMSHGRDRLLVSGDNWR
jgi:hypothetical protein